jgi:glycosyltransferase involved in cell wall biosynthesis
MKNEKKTNFLVKRNIDFSKQWQRKNYRVVIMTRDDPTKVFGGVETFNFSLSRVFPDSKIIYYSGTSGKRLLFNEARDARASWRHLSNWLVSNEVDVVIANGAAAWSRNNSKMWPDKLPLITVYHGTYAGFGRILCRYSPIHGFWARIVGGFLERLAGQNSTSSVAVSRSVRNEVAKFYGVRARVIENAVVVGGSSGEKPVKNEKCSFHQNKPVVFFVGRATWAKGFDLVIKLAKCRPNFVIVAAGVPPTRGLPSNIDALGSVSVDRMKKLYSACDAVILPSRYEGCSFTLLEAMAAGKPVITSAVGAFKEIGSHQFGVTVKSGDARKFLKAIDYVLANKDSFRPVDYVTKRFSFEKFSKAWRTLVCELFDGK